MTRPRLPLSARAVMVLAGVLAAAAGVAALSFTQTDWTFSTIIGQYNYNGSKIEVTGGASGVAQLKATTFQDTDSTAGTFNGSHNATQFDTSADYLRLSQNGTDQLSASNLDAIGVKAFWGFNGNSWLDSTTTSSPVQNGLTPGPAGAAPTFTASGKFSTGLLFDGVDDYATSPSQAEIEPASTVTLETWVRFTATAGEQGLLMKTANPGGAAPVPAYALLKNASNKFEFRVGDASTTLPVQGLTTVASGTWYHVAGTYDGTVARLYVNGKLDGVASGAVVPSYTGSATIRPLRDLGTTASGSTTSGGLGYTGGYLFTPQINGQVTEICDQCYGICNSNRVNRVWQVSNGATLYSGPIHSSPGGTGWYCNAISPAVNVTAGTQYLGTVYTASSSQSAVRSYSNLPWNYSAVGTSLLNVSLFRGGNGSTMPANSTGTNLIGVPDITFVVSNLTDALFLGSLRTASGAASPLNGILDQVIIAAQAWDAATIRSHAIPTYAPTGAYTSPVMDSTVSGVPVRKWRTLGWVEGGLNSWMGEPISATTPGLVGLWSFEENGGQFAAPSAGAATGVLGATSTPEPSDPGWTDEGRVGKALLFDGVDDRVSISPTPLTAVDNWTLEAWVSYAGGGGGAAGGAVVCVDGTGANGYCLWRTGSAGTSNLISVRYGGSTYFSTGVPYDVNAWNHIAVVRRSGVLEVYKNGERIGPDADLNMAIDDLDGATAPTAPGVAAAVTIGGYKPGALNSGFRGRIDEVALYSAALAPGTILQHAQQGGGDVRLAMRTGPSNNPNDGTWTDWRPRPVLPDAGAAVPADRSDLRALWHFDEGVGSPVFRDSVGGANRLPDDGTLPVGGVSWDPAGAFGWGLRFDGTGGVEIPTSPDLRIGPDHTVEARVKFTSLGGQQTILAHPSSALDNPARDRDAYALYKDATNHIVFEFGNAFLTDTLTSTTTVQADTWYHIVGVFSPSGSTRLYINGQMEAATSDLAGFIAFGALYYPDATRLMESAVGLGDLWMQAPATCNGGYSFTPSVNGQVVALGGRWQTTPVTQTVRLYRDSDGSLLGSADVTSGGQPAYAPINGGTPVALTAGVTYVVAVQNDYSAGAGWLKTPIGWVAMPVTAGGITVNEGRALCNGSINAPTVANGASTQSGVVYGVPDVAFVAHASARPVLALGQAYTAAGAPVDLLQGVLDEVALYRLPLEARFGLSPADLTGLLEDNTYGQYRVTLDTGLPEYTPYVDRVDTTASSFPNDKPSIKNLLSGLAPAFDALQNFSVVQAPPVGSPEGSATFRISRDGTTWYYVNGGAWAASSGAAETNDAATIAANLSTFPAQVGSGNLFWEAFLHSDGDQQVRLDTISVQHASASLQLTPPAPGTLWRMGTTPDITWTSSGISDVKLEYSPGADPAPFVEIIPTTPALPGSVPWNLTAAVQPSASVGSGRIRLTTLDASGGHLTDTKSGYTVTRPAFVFEPPFDAPGSQFPVSTVAGTEQRITWTSDGGPISGSLTLAFVKGGAPTTINANIQNGLNNCLTNPPASGGCYDWYVPAGAVGPSVILRITDNAAPFGTGDSAPFKVTGILTVAVPDASTVWAAGQAHDIEWTTQGGITDVVIQYSPTGVAPFATISGGSPISNSSPFPWTPSAADASTGGVIRLVDGNDNTVFDDSPAFLLTTAAVQPPACPGNRCLVGTTQTISWTHVGLSEVKLYYAKDGTTYTEIDPAVVKPAGPAGSGSYDWPIPLDAIKRDTVTIKIEDALRTGLAQASAVSTPFTVHGAIAFDAPLDVDPASGGFTCTSGQACTVNWTTTGVIPQVLMEYTLDGSLYNLFAGTNPVANTDTYSWNPSVTSNFIKVRVTDAQDNLTLATSGAFSIGGIGITAPTSASVWNVGSTQTISWNKTGSFSFVSLAYSTDGATWTVINPKKTTNATDSLNWLVPDAISTTARIRIARWDDPATPEDESILQAISDLFSIRGVLNLTAPDGGQVFTVGQSDAASLIQWTTTGTIPTVLLQLSTNGGTTWTTDLTTITGNPGSGTTPAPNSYPWTVSDAISDQVKVRVVDTVAGHPASDDASLANFTIKGTFGFVDPPASTGIGWGVYELKPIQWTTTGAIGRVTVEYRADGSSAWTVAEDDAGTPASDIVNLGSFLWKVPDVVSAFVTAQGKTPGDGTADHRVPTVQVRVRDVDPAHAAAARGEQPSLPFTVKWFRIKWVVKNADTGAELAELNVQDTSVVPNWIVDNLQCLPGFDACLSSPVYRHYPFGSYVTKWIKKDFTPNTVTGWAALRDATAGSAGAEAWDKINPISLTSAIPDPTVYQVRLEPLYDSGTDTMKFKTWLEKQGQLPIDPTLFGPAMLEIYDGINPVPLHNVTVNPPMTGGVPNADWQKNYDFTIGPPTNLSPGTIYFIKASITYEGKVRSSGSVANVLIASNQALTLAALQNELQPIGTQVGEIHGEVVGAGPVSRLQTVLDNQAAIRADIATAKTDLQADVAGVKADTDAIKLATVGDGAGTPPTLETAIGARIDAAEGNITAYLADPTSGLPALQAQLSGVGTQVTNIETQGKALRRGGILNRDMELEEGEMARLQYRSEGGVPVLTVYDAAGSVVGGIPPLALNPASGLYESSITLAALGEYRAVVTEPASAESAGTVDSVTLTMRKSLATNENLYSGVAYLGGRFDTVDAQLAAVEADVNALIATAAAIQATTDATKTQADSIKADAQTLLDKWGALDAAALDAGLAGLSAALGTPPAGSSIAGELAAVRARTDTIDWADVSTLRSEIGTGNITAIRTKTDTINWADVTGLVTTAGAIKATTDTINWADVTAVKTKTDTINWTDVTALGTAVAQVQTDMAKDATVAKDADLQSALTQLGSVQNSLTALSAQVGNTAQQASLDAALVLLNDIRTNMPVGGTDLTDVNTKLDALQATLAAVPTGDVDLTEVTAQLDTVEQTLASLQSQQVESETLFARLDALDSAVASAEGSSAAVSFSQNAFTAASEAVSLLQQVQADLKANGKDASLAPVLLGKFGDKLQTVSQAITVIPGQLDTEALQAQIAQIAKQMQAVASEKGYEFDSLYQMSEAQRGDVKVVRNHVQELKALVEVQRAILEQKLNQPVVKTWFESAR